MKKLSQSLLLFVFCLMFVACGKITIQQNLTEKEANELVVALQENGVVAEIQTAGREPDFTWLVLVGSSDETKARAVMAQNNLPRRKELLVDKICGTSNFANSNLERCKANVTKQWEIAKQLISKKDVIDADVVLQIPIVNEFITETQAKDRPTAAVHLKIAKTKSGLEITDAVIQRQVASAVQNLDPRDVSVIIDYVETAQTLKASGVSLPYTEVLGLKIHPDSVSKFKTIFLTLLILLLMVSAGMVFSLLLLFKMKKGIKDAQVSMALVPQTEEKQLETIPSEQMQSMNSSDPFKI